MNGHLGDSEGDCLVGAQHADKQGEKCCPVNIVVSVDREMCYGKALVTVNPEIPNKDGFQ